MSLTEILKLSAVSILFGLTAIIAVSLIFSKLRKKRHNQNY